MRESKRHLDIRTALYLLLKRRLAAAACIGSDQFVYWNAANPKRCLAPDVFVRRGGPDETFPSWKTWERGAPELAVEIVSESDSSEDDWDDKLARYKELGVIELVRFDADASTGARLRLWDRVEGDLVERVLGGDAAPSEVLGAFWVVSAAADDLPVALRVAERADGGGLWPTADDDRRRADDAERARDEATRRIPELEAELARTRAR